jgi:hypothetical protein
MEAFELMLEGVLENLECLNLLFLLILLRFMNYRFFRPIFIMQLLAYAIILSIIIFHKIPKIIGFSLLACQLLCILLVLSDLEYLFAEDFDDFFVSFVPFYI